MFMSTMLAHSKVVEVSILIAEELLACPADQDFVRKETSNLIVTKEERISKTWDMTKKARDALQEAVVLMGQVAGGGARNTTKSTDSLSECFFKKVCEGQNIGFRVCHNNIEHRV